MKLAMILGKKQGDSIKPRLKSIKDNLDIDIFENVGEFVFSVTRRNTIYDRILVLSNRLNPKTLNDLNACWGMYSKETAVIMLGRKDADEHTAQAFLDMFQTPVACAMMVTNTTVQIISDSVCKPISELNATYGYKNVIDIEVDEDEFVLPEPEKPVESIKPAVQPPVQQPAQTIPQKKKKRGFLSGLFGSRGINDDTVQLPEPVATHQEPVLVEEGFEQPDSGWQGTYYPDEPHGISGQETSSCTGWSDIQSAPESDFESDKDNPTLQSGDQFSDFGDDLGSIIISCEDDFSDGISAEPAHEGIGARQPSVQPKRPQQRRPQQPVTQPQAQQSRRQNSNVTLPPPSSIVDVTFDAGLGDDDFQDDGVVQRGQTADIDFGSDGILTQTPQSKSPRQPRSVEADENLGDVSVIADEAKYRQQREAPKTIIKTVHEPALGSGSALKGVYSGRLKKVIIVTGDRGTGVTSTALSLARELAKHVEVLYFDCDTLNHGLLNYIDYSIFSGYEQIHLEGVKSCKSSKVFDRCIIDWDENFGLLSSDFSCECDDEELTHTAQVVAECSDNFGVVVVDCPMSKLYCLQDLVLIGSSVVCVEASKRGFMNMLCQLEACTLPMRYKRHLASKGTMFLTKCSPKTDVKRLLAYIKSIYQPDGVDWMGLPLKQFNGKVDDNLLNTVLEG